MGTLREFLNDKKIAAEAFASARPEEFAIWEREFNQLGALAFDQRKKFFLNPLRLEFPLQSEETRTASAEDGTK